MSHTPGPWTWGDGWNEKHKLIDEYDGREKYMDMQLRGAGRESIIPIRIDHYEPEWDCDENCEGPKVGDRNLIAAAPDLLKACQEALDWRGFDGDGITNPTWDLIRKAVAKAEGKDV